MHIGMDTVGLDGKGFESHVSQGDHVTVGQKLISFDMDVIKDAGLVTETPVIITNQDAYTATIEEQTRKLAAGCSKHRFEVVDRTDEVSSKHCFEVVDGTDVVSILHIR